jgi:hypothetical protein
VPVAQASDDPSSSGSPVKSPAPCPTPIDISSILTAELTVLNVATKPVHLVVGILNPDDGTTFPVIDEVLGANNSVERNAPPSIYELEFTAEGAATAFATCRLTVADGEAYDFVAAEDLVTVLKRGAEPSDPAEIFVDTSTLCRLPEASPS